MKTPNKLVLGLFFSFNLVFCSQVGSETRIQNNEVLFSEMKKLRNLSSEQITSIKEIFSQSNRIGQGNPAVTRHPISPEEAAASLGNNIETAQNSYRRRNFERICGRPFMAPIYDPLSQKPNEATVCMDMFEYPNIPMVYPVVWVSAKEAALLCAAEGKRLSDAHEWEGAAAGNLLEPDYPFELIKGLDINSAVKIMRIGIIKSMHQLLITILLVNGNLGSARRDLSKIPLVTAAVIVVAGQTPILRDLFQSVKAH